MKKLFFSLAASRKLGLTFSTHRSSMMSLQPGNSDILPIKEDEVLTDAELLAFYDRYKSSGLTTKFLENPKNIFPTVTEPEGTKIKDLPDANKGASLPTPEEAPVVTTSAEDKAPELPAEQTSSSDEETSGVEEAAVETEAEVEDVDSWEFAKMRDFVKENNIDVDGRSKEDHIKAIKEFLAKEA